MPRNLDMTALRSFAMVADAGGVTRAAGLLHLTQSAVSMQLKRLEESLGRPLLERSGRGVSLTADGEQVLGYARKMLHLNDEVFARLTDQAYEGEIVIGVPDDIVYPAIPAVLSRFAAEYPRMKVQLVCSFTRNLRAMFARGACDIVLTTEDSLDAGGETLRVLPLIWIGAPDGHAWKTRPLKLAFETTNIFRQSVEEALDRHGIAWEMAIESDSSRSIEASVSADLAVNAVIEGTEPPRLGRIQHGGALPDLTSKQVNLYVADTSKGPVVDEFLALLRQAYQDI